MKRALAVAVALAGLAGAAAAQEKGAPAGPYVIRSVDFKIQGRTKDFVLLAIIDPYERIVGSSFQDRAGLEAFVADKRSLLASQRVLASAAASYTLAIAAGGGYDVALTFATTDSWNIIALPYPNYDSNDGLLLSLRGRDYDFLGSAQPLELNLNYQQSPSGLSSFGTQLDFVAPFRAMGAVWDFAFAEDGQLWTDWDGELHHLRFALVQLPRLGLASLDHRRPGILLRRRGSRRGP